MLSRHIWTFIWKPRQPQKLSFTYHGVQSGSSFCQVVIVAPYWPWQFPPGTAIWEFSFCLVSSILSQMGWKGSHRTCYLDPWLLLWSADNTFSAHKQEIFYLQWFPKVFSGQGLFCHSLGIPCHCPLLQRACFPAGERHVERSIEPIPETSTTMVPHPAFHLSAQQTQGLLWGKRLSRAKLHWLHWLSFSILSAIPRILEYCFPGVLARQQA